MQNNYKNNYTPEMFHSEISNVSVSEQISRPTLTYFQDAIIRLKNNKIAMISFYFLVFMCCVGIFGPMFFPNTGTLISYENYGYLNALNQNPSFNGHKLLVTDGNLEQPEPKIKENFITPEPPPVIMIIPDQEPVNNKVSPEQIKQPKFLEIKNITTVDGVFLEWEPVLGVDGYIIYRTEITNENISLTELKNSQNKRGSQITTIDNPAQYSYIDAMALDASSKYAYSIVSYKKDLVDDSIIESLYATAIETSLVRTIKHKDALTIKKDVKIGEFITAKPNYFGTDKLGRDIFARMIQGTRIDFFLALVVPLIALFIGIFYGAISALLGGKTDLIMMRIAEILESIPQLLIFIILQLILKDFGLISLVISMSSLSWIAFARLIRGEVLRLREIEFVHASHLLGANLFRQITKHITPNLIGIIIVVWTTRIPGVITTEAILSLLGLGIKAPDPSWGTVISEAGQNVQVYPAQFFLPAIVMSLALLAFFQLGDGLTDAFDPKQRGRS